jgi:hypothetical protein
VADQELQLWKWQYTDETGKRRVTTWRMTEDTVKQFAQVYRDAERIEGTLEIRETLGSTSAFQTSPKGSWTRA